MTMQLIKEGETMIVDWERHITENTYDLDKDVKQWELNNGHKKYTMIVKYPKWYISEQRRMKWLMHIIIIYLIAQ